MSSSPPPLPRHRHLPLWAWIVAILCFPSGPFIACGAARLLSWGWAIALTILSFITVQAPMVGLEMPQITGQDMQEITGLMDWVRTNSLQIIERMTAEVLILAIWGIVLYQIGRRASYWSSWARRAFFGSAWLAGILLCLLVAAFTLQLLSARLEANM